MLKLSVAGLALLATTAAADQVQLKSGGTLSGRILERTAARLVIEVGPGRVTVPAARVARVTLGASALADFEERASRLAQDDAPGWLELGTWASERGLNTQARAALARVLLLDPQNPAAQAALGNVLVNGRWLTPAEAYRARGYVLFEGSWLLPEERDERIREREYERASRQARIESDALVREAEARARAAEAEARRAEAERQASEAGIPYSPYGFGVGPWRRAGRQAGGHGAVGAARRPGRVPPPPSAQAPPPPPRDRGVSPPASVAQAGVGAREER